MPLLPPRPRMLLIHNRYRWSGGECREFESDVRQLREAGHDVATVDVSNEDILRRGRTATLRALWRSAWNEDAAETVRRRVREERPDVVQVYNTWFALSPAALAACHDENVPVVVRLGNFRPLCAGATLSRDGGVCLACVERGGWHGVWHGCYHGSRLLSWFATRCAQVHRRRGTWQRDVDLFLTPSRAMIDVYASSGFPADAFVVKPNAIDDPGQPQPPGDEAWRRILYVGRLSEEKGLTVLLRAWRQVAAQRQDVELVLIGDGPLARDLRRDAPPGVVFRGACRPEEVAGAVRGSLAVVLPSVCHETFGRSIAEGFAGARAGIVSDIGGQAELIEPEVTGLRSRAGDPEDLARTILRLLNDPSSAVAMGEAARRVYLERYAPGPVYAGWIQALEFAAQRHQQHAEHERVQLD